MARLLACWERARVPRTSTTKVELYTRLGQVYETDGSGGRRIAPTRPSTSSNGERFRDSRSAHFPADRSWVECSAYRAAARERAGDVQGRDRASMAHLASERLGNKDAHEGGSAYSTAAARTGSTRSAIRRRGQSRWAELKPTTRAPLRHRRAMSTRTVLVRRARRSPNRMTAQRSARNLQRVLDIDFRTHGAAHPPPVETSGVAQRSVQLTAGCTRPSMCGRLLEPRVKESIASSGALANVWISRSIRGSLAPPARRRRRRFRGHDRAREDLSSRSALGRCRGREDAARGRAR